MKKAITIITLFIVSFGVLVFTNKTYAAEQILDSDTESKLIEIKDNEAKSLKDYQEKYSVIDDDSETEAMWIDINRFRDKELTLYPEQIFKYLF